MSLQPLVGLLRCRVQFKTIPADRGPARALDYRHNVFYAKSKAGREKSVRGAPFKIKEA